MIVCNYRWVSAVCCGIWGRSGQSLLSQSQPQLGFKVQTFGQSGYRSTSHISLSRWSTYLRIGSNEGVLFHLAFYLSSLLSFLFFLLILSFFSSLLSSLSLILLFLLSPHHIPLPPSSSLPVDKISHLVMLPLPDGCTLHACYNGKSHITYCTVY